MAPPSSDTRAEAPALVYIQPHCSMAGAGPWPPTALPHPTINDQATVRHVAPPPHLAVLAPNPDGEQPPPAAPPLCIRLFLGVGVVGASRKFAVAIVLGKVEPRPLRRLARRVASGRRRRGRCRRARHHRLARGGSKRARLLRPRLDILPIHLGGSRLDRPCRRGARLGRRLGARLQVGPHRLAVNVGHRLLGRVGGRRGRVAGASGGGERPRLGSRVGHIPLDLLPVDRRNGRLGRRRRRAGLARRLFAVKVVDSVAELVGPRLNIGSHRVRVNGARRVGSGARQLARRALDVGSSGNRRPPWSSPPPWRGPPRRSPSP
eukprot:TRINITY_DN2070_c0_g1_i1.p1 TRINITY_DN2070_c0_g1~~TRINITY_DN2070_c0_g1_i1.p1  ORF type:complete len:334 (+),score=68.76 TRINITY_DN2070_c0_g1_i1:44-1003(+)